MASITHQDEVFDPEGNVVESRERIVTEDAMAPHEIAAIRLAETEGLLALLDDAQSMADLREAVRSILGAQIAAQRAILTPAGARLPFTPNDSPGAQNGP